MSDDLPIGMLFDDLAEEYVELRDDVGWNPWPHVAEAFGEGSLAGQRLLDVGCGVGEVSAGLAARGAMVTGVDASERMCELAAERLPDAPFLWHDLAEGLPFPADLYDGVLALGCVEYVPDVEFACAELVRVVRPGGVVLYVVELCEPGLAGGVEREVSLYEAWRRYRRTWDEVEAAAARMLSHFEMKRVPGYVFEETGEQVGYARVIGRV